MTIFEKIYKFDKKQALKDIIKRYKEQWFWVVNYLYFANLVSNWIISGKNINKEYFSSLEIWDFLLPDWIALQLYYKKYFWFDLSNLNWTDFADYFLENLKDEEYNLISYWAKKEVIENASKNIEQKYGIKVAYFQDGYSEFDFEKLENLPKWKINIFFIWLWTPKQEIWIKDNLENIKKYNLLAFSQWWTFDFWAWNEKRAPKIFISLKLEWLWRFITNPKKNFKKVWYSFYLFYFLGFKKKSTKKSFDKDY